MGKRLLYFLINVLWFLLCIKQQINFKRSSSNVEHTQQRLLLRILKRNSNTIYGRRFGFSKIADSNDFRMKVPLSTYDSYVPYINLIREGKQHVITSEQVLALIPSSGSTAPSKYIPFTQSLRQQFLQGINPWFFNLFTSKKRLLFGSSYWSVTPLGTENKNAGIKVGFEDDSEYLGSLGRYLSRILFAVPKEVASIKDIEAFRYVTLLFLLKDRNLAYISVWNPTFLPLLLQPLLKWHESLINDIRNGTITSSVSIDGELRQRISERLPQDKRRAKELSAIFKRWEEGNKKSPRTRSLYEVLWSNLALISCWADGNAAHYVQQIKECFPNVEIQPKGLMATEGIISFPCAAKGKAVLSINSHFFEFIEIEKTVHAIEGCFHETKLAHQLTLGRLYSVVITTGGGLYRYRLQDIIKVVGFKDQCPLIRFMGKENKISDLFGEKLNEYHIGCALKAVFKEYSLAPSFYMVAPEKELFNHSHFYAVFLQFASPNNRSKGMLESLNEAIERKLQENYHYKYCRNLGQLSKLRIFMINPEFDVQETYLRTQQAFSQRIGGIKTATLSSKTGWSKIFGGNFV